MSRELWNAAKARREVRRTAEEIDEGVLNLIQKGLRNAEIVRETDLSHGQVRYSVRRLKKQGKIPEENLRNGPVAERREKVYDLLCEDMEAKEIAAELGLEEKTVRDDLNALKKMGWIV